MTSPGQVPIFDGHNDVLFRLFRRGGSDAPRAFLEGEGKGQLDFPMARQGGFAGGLFAIFVPSAKPTREFPRLCRGGSKSLTYPEVGSLGPWTGLQTVSHQAHERSPANGVATRSKATRLQMDGLPESEVRMSEKHTRFLGRHCAMRVGMRIDAARTSRFERLQS